MSVELLDGTTICDFVKDEKAFGRSVEEWFAGIDTDHDGLLSYAEMAEELRSLRMMGEAMPGDEELCRIYHVLFGQFDHDGNGTVDLAEFTAEAREMMLAVADGVGFLPLQMVLEEGSILKKAAEYRESANAKVA